MKIIPIALLLCLFANGKGQAQLPRGAVGINYHRHHIYFDCEIENRQASLVFDTGATNLYLDSTWYDDNGLSFDQVALANLPGVGNKPQKVRLILNEVGCNVGNSVYNTRQVPIFQLKPILGDVADGIIGLDHFSNQVLQLSYEEEYIKTFDAISEVDIKGYSKVPMRREKNRLFITASIRISEQLNIEGEFLLDLGAGGSFILTTDTGNTYKLSNAVDRKIKYSTIAGGIGGKSERYVIRAAEAGLGDFLFDQPIIDYSLDQGGALVNKKHLGLIGNEILERFDIIIDFKENNLYLKPNSKKGEAFRLSRHGFSYVDRSETLGGWIVKGFYENCEALNKGMMPGDKIIAVDGIPVENISTGEQELIFRNNEGIILDYLRDGKTIRIKLTLDFDKTSKL